MLATIKAHFGELDKIKRIVKTLGMVNCTAEFGQQPQVINGFSELMAEVFGHDNGVGVRSAVGMILPNNIAVEIEAMFEILVKYCILSVQNFIEFTSMMKLKMKNGLRLQDADEIPSPAYLYILTG